MDSFDSIDLHEIIEIEIIIDIRRFSEDRDIRICGKIKKLN